MNFFGLKPRRRQLLLLFLDGLVVLVALSLAHAIRLDVPITPAALWQQFEARTGAALLALAIHLSGLYIFECYTLADDWKRPRNLLKPAIASFCAVLGLAIVYYLLPSWRFGRGILVLHAAFVMLGTVAVRFFFSFVFSVRMESEKTILMGAGRSGRYFVDTLSGRPETQLKILAIFDIRKELQGHYKGIPVLQPDYEGFHQQIAGLGANRIVVTGSHGWDERLIQLMLNEKVGGLVIENMAGAFKRLLGRVPVGYVDSAFFIFGPGFVLNRSHVLRNMFRVLDFGVAAVGLVLSLPLMLFSALLVLLSDGRPVLFAQERLGLDRRPFTLYKFRTMRKDAEKHSGPRWATQDDPRITRVGRLLRKTRFDELPQLWNVLMGDMSLVGPRPERAHFIEQLEQEIPHYNLRFTIRPGITGWAQVNFHYGASVEDARIKLEYELFYIQEMSLPLYLLTVLKTVQTILLGKGM